MVEKSFIHCSEHADACGTSENEWKHFELYATY